MRLIKLNLLYEGVHNDQYVRWIHAAVWFTGSATLQVL